MMSKCVLALALTSTAALQQGQVSKTMVDRRVLGAGLISTIGK